MNNSSVGDFAEQILAQERASNGAPSPVQVAPSVSQLDTSPMPDISQVIVSNDFVGSLVEGTLPSSEAGIPVVENTTPVVEDTTELRGLIHEVRDLLVEVKQTLTEVTACGSLGVNMAGPQKKKKEEDDLTNLLRKVRQKRASR